MSPERLEELADLADPQELWKRAAFERLDFTPEQKRQLDTGVALRRYAGYERRLRTMLGTGRSLVITPLSENGVATMTIEAPAAHRKLLREYKASNVRGEPGHPAQEQR